jgi:hypothetical protein
MLACWEKLGPLDPEGSGRAAKKASAAKREMTFLRPFLSGQLETLRMTFPRILAAIGLYLGLLLFFVVVLALAASVGTGAGAEAHQQFGGAIRGSNSGQFGGNSGDTIPIFSLPFPWLAWAAGNP